MTAKTVIVTGAGAGLGRAFAIDLAKRGDRLVLADINEDGLEGTGNAIRSAGGQALVVRADITSEEAVNNLVRQSVDTFGSADVLINSAAILATLSMRAFDTIPLSEWEQVLRVNVTGTFLCCKAVAEPMKRQGWGRIINLSSDTALMGMTSYLHYTTSKAAILGMTRSIARELGAFGVTANCVLPGATETEIERPQEIVERRARAVKLQCIPRQQTPEDLLGTIRFLASDESAFLTGQPLLVNGGACHL